LKWTFFDSENLQTTTPTRGSLILEIFRKHISRGYKQPQRTTQQLLFHCCWWWWWWWWANWFQCPTLHCQNLKLISGQQCSAKDSIIRPNFIASIPIVQVQRVAYLILCKFNLPNKETNHGWPSANHQMIGFVHAKSVVFMKLHSH
jgi:hypothetical protein